LGRHGGQVDAVGFEYRGVHFGQDTLNVFPGLCAVDNPQNVEATFKAIGAAGVKTARMGAYKPRTSPYDFQGHGKDCLPYVFDFAAKYGIQVVAMEITREAHLDEIRDALHKAGNPTGVMLQIGTRNAQNFELLKVAGQQRDFPSNSASAPNNQDDLPAQLFLRGLASDFSFFQSPILNSKRLRQRQCHIVGMNFKRAGGRRRSSLRQGRWGIAQT